MRTIREFFLVMIVLLSLQVISSCQKDILEVSSNEIIFDNTQSPQTISMTANVPWTIKANDSWITIDPASGSGSATLSFKATINSFGTERKSTITISGGKKGEIVVPISVKQPTTLTTFIPDTTFIEKDGGSKTIEVKSNGEWEVFTDGENRWLSSITPKKGIGNQSISITASASDVRKDQIAALIFRSGTYSSRAYVVLRGKGNTSPNKPILVTPTDKSTSVSVTPKFSWSCTDPDGDELIYELNISKDQTTWLKEKTYNTTFISSRTLDPNTNYFWKIVADDGNGRANSTSESDIFTFTTGGKTNYDDGESWLILSSSKARPINLVITGDGYISEDFKHGGTFESNAREAVESLFSIEPYKTYKEYFNVWVIAAYSTERGMTITGKQTRNTKFKVTKTGDGTSLTCNYDGVFNWVKKIPIISDDELDKTSIILMSNEDLYAGTCWMWTSGRSIGIAPVSRRTNSGMGVDFKSIVMHECGGHGFGRLADEYINYSNQTIPDTGDWSKSSLKSWQSAGGLLNVSLSNVEAEVPWYELIGKSGYGRITNPEGGLYYSFGVWRSEVTSCMINNLHYYSAAQRLRIVNRILTVSGEGFTIDKFIQNDIQKSPSAAVMTQSRMFNPFLFVPLGRPVVMK